MKKILEKIVAGFL